MEKVLPSFSYCPEGVRGVEEGERALVPAFDLPGWEEG